MSTDRLLARALRDCQEAPPPGQTQDQAQAHLDRLFATTTTLLTHLNNPLNVSLLTAHLLMAPALWDRPRDGLRTCLRLISVYNTAAMHVLRNEQENAELTWGQPPVGSELGCEKWARAVAKGADDRSPRWKHLLVLAGVLMGLENGGQTPLSGALRSALQRAVVTAANLALEDPFFTPELGSHAVVLALSYTFPTLSDSAKRSLNCDLVLPAAMRAMAGEEGFGLIGGRFLIPASAEHVAAHGPLQLHATAYFEHVQTLQSRPLVQNMGSLSRLTAFAVQNALHFRSVVDAQDGLLNLSATLLSRWRQTPLSTVDVSTEDAVFSPEIVRGPWALLWQSLKKIMYTVVAVLQSIVGRCLVDPHLRADSLAPSIASKTLGTLRSLYFVSSRKGADAFQVYTFTYLTSIDMLARYPEACVSFLRESQPPPQQSSSPPPTPLDQAIKLFYLNTAEHLPLSIPTAEAENLIVEPATAHLSTDFPQSSLTMPLFEAAHSAILSTLSCPQHSHLTISLLPFYIETLLSSFPARISPRQFRLAFKTITQIVSPPFPISATHPHLSESLLEMLHFRAASASADPLPPDAAVAATSPSPGFEDKPSPPLSEQATLVLALIDSVPFLPLPSVEEWLTRTAEALNAIADAGMRDTARRRFWDVLVNGEMDVERAAIGVAWWGTKGGREMVLLNAARRPAEDEYLMSGALTGRSEQSSRL